MLSRLLQYILYRHLVKGLFDGDLLSQARFSCEAVNYIGVCLAREKAEKGKLTETDIINTVKYWSKQIEYSEEAKAAL